MKERLRVGILFGGQSLEHDVSITSALTIFENIDQSRFEPIPIGIDKQGDWHFFQAQPFVASAGLQKRPSFKKDDPHFPIIQPVKCYEGFFSPNQLRHIVDVAFPIIHGINGEDGTLQGLLKLSQIPFVGSSMLSSAICMDKSIMKIILRENGLITAKSLTLRSKESIDLKEIIKKIQFPFFVKPANGGSSIGVSKAYSSDTALLSIEKAFEYDEKIIIEEYIDGREIECSVIGNLTPTASLPGEVIPQHDFYSYEAKYFDTNGAFFQLPAKLPLHIKDKVQALSVEAFKALCCEGMARVDFFLRSKDEALFINEINTVPGFTSTSLYPKLWEISGLSPKELISRLIELSIERFERQKHCLCSFF